ncbi:hypothetical protein I3842_14G134900 [Carya illinoinensis]|uniref:Uncharacterized protein n=1 Tax=Carya illinoinensis TaxID=32201 RepID=A0A922AIE2_CARIL|nr:hypothetical protein I3842_14G134900 [Carya illinoinensis]
MSTDDSPEAFELEFSSHRLGCCRTACSVADVTACSSIDAWLASHLKCPVFQTNLVSELREDPSVILRESSLLLDPKATTTMTNFLCSVFFVLIVRNDETFPPSERFPPPERRSSFFF